MVEVISEIFTVRGEQYKILPVSCMPKLEKDVYDVEFGKNSSDFTKGIVKHCYDLQLPKLNFDIASIIVVASPSPIVRIFFHIGKKRIPVIMPPTYMEWVKKLSEIENALNKELNTWGYHVKAAEKLPQKLLAVRSGLCQYGRNNISYANELGSFIRLSTYFTDISGAETQWQELKQRASCRICKLCLNNCPTKAISEDRYLVDAEKCLTCLNEHAGIEFPNWIDASAHNSIVGCMKCQEICPKNKKVLGNIIEPVEFTKEETAYMLDDKPLDGATDAFIDKLKLLGIYEYYDVIPRNLRVLINKQEY